MELHAKEMLVHDPEGAALAVSQIASPTAIKIVSPDILHKTEAGGVRLGVSKPEEARTAAEQILESCLRYAPQARIDGISVQQMVPAGVEIVLGVKNDRQFGPLVAAGLGGIMVELIADTAVRLAPVGRTDRAHDAGFPEGLSAAEGLSRQAGRGCRSVVDTICRLSELAHDLQDVIDQIDVNPAIASTKFGYFATGPVAVSPSSARTTSRPPSASLPATRA